MIYFGLKYDIFPGSYDDRLRDQESEMQRVKADMGELMHVYDDMQVNRLY